MQSIIDELNNEIPELKDIVDTPENVEYVLQSNWDIRVTRIFKANLKKYGCATTPSGLDYYLSPCIIAHHLTSGEPVIEINRKKYLLIRKYLLSEQKNK